MPGAEGCYSTIIIQQSTIYLSLRSRSRSFNFRRGVEVFEVLGEAVAEIFRRFVVGGFVGPGVARIEDLGWNSVAELRNAKSKGGLDFEILANQFAFHGRIDHGAGMRDAHTPAHAVG